MNISITRTFIALCPRSIFSGLFLLLLMFLKTSIAEEKFFKHYKGCKPLFCHMGLIFISVVMTEDEKFRAETGNFMAHGSQRYTGPPEQRGSAAAHSRLSNVFSLGRVSSLITGFLCACWQKKCVNSGNNTLLCSSEWNNRYHRSPL